MPFGWRCTQKSFPDASFARSNPESTGDPQDAYEGGPKSAWPVAPSPDFTDHAGSCAPFSVPGARATAVAFSLTIWSPFASTAARKASSFAAVTLAAIFSASLYGRQPPPSG